MAVIEQKLIVFAYLDTEWVPCGQLTLTEVAPAFRHLDDVSTPALRKQIP
jgi:hypothetical protein